MKKFLSTTKGKIIAGAVTFAVIAAAIVLIVLLNMGYRSIQVADLNGSTKLTSGFLVSEAFKGQNLQNGTSVSVSEKSDLTLALDTDKHVFAKELTKFKLEALGTAAKDSRTIIHLEEGSVLSEIDEKLLESESYVVDSPNATMAVRGTTFTVTVSYDAAGLCHTSVEVEKGTVEVTEKDENGKLTDKTQTLNAGDNTEVISEVKRVENPAAGAPGSGNSNKPHEWVYQDHDALAVESAIETYLNGGDLDKTNFDRVTDLEIYGRVAFVTLDHVVVGRTQRPGWNSTNYEIDNVHYLSDTGEEIEIPTSNSNLTDLSFLTGMKNLERLKISFGNVTDITPIGQMSQLRDLDLEMNKISDITPLENLTNLFALYLDHNQISDISSIKELKNLKFLYLRFNNISDLSPIGNLTKLHSLGVDSDNISDLSPISGLTNLTELDFDSNNISDLSPISGLTNLTSLSFTCENISDLSPISGLTNLTLLAFSGDNISDLSPISGLTNLNYLEINSDNISDISPIANFHKLESANIYCDSLNDYSPLYGLTNLQRISCGEISDDELAKLQQALPGVDINHY